MVHLISYHFCSYLEDMHYKFSLTGTEQSHPQSQVTF